MACHPESPCSSASASSQELDDQSTDEITQSFATTTLDSSPSDHNSHNPLLSLPDEILGSALSYLKNNDHLSLQLTSRRLFQCSSISVKDLDATEHEAFSTTMKREAYHAAESEEAAGNRSSIRRPCGVCIDVHPFRHFSAIQLMRSASKRGCLRSERKLVICEHMSTTLLELTTQVTSEIGCLEHGAREQQIKQYMCLHPDHRDHDLAVGRTVYLTLELKLGGQGPVLASKDPETYEALRSQDVSAYLDGE
ncbi:hypothetical protein B0A55_09202 [Friedmanniomyces simplex]|uniref:F-box domain-containing protein n=1 Tax=Friedmanniomyces simplex TaxID=329884 RepID=A0A4U0WXC3_9PEZI|nr:hypothetical protein B0A55_09202 [Friedmanniomyces simplex]